MKSDSELRQDVQAELGWEPSFDERRIGVAVKDAVVTLTGEVGSFAQKWNAERAVERVNGVRGVANDLEVPRLASTATWRSPGQPRTRCDGTAWCPQTASPQRWKRLDQAHRPRRSRLRAPRRGRAVRYLSGVRGVSNLVTVKAVTARAKPKNIKADIERIFQRQAALDAKQVSVEVSGDVVTLRGQVRSWAERREAERVAWAAPGVSNVRNNITTGGAA